MYYQQVIPDGQVSGHLGYSLYCFACLHFLIFVMVMCAHVFNKNTIIIRKMDGTRRRGAFIMLKKGRQIQS